MFPPSYIELSRSALRNNINVLQEEVGSDVRISGVVKGNAYGHGIEEMVPLIEEAGIDHIAVYNADEALRVCEVKQERTDVMIMGMIDNEELFWAIENDVEMYVFEMDRLEQIVGTAKRVQKPARIHLQLETGMNRLGFDREQLSRKVRFLKDQWKSLEFMGVCTHFAGAEHIANYFRVTEQFRQYKKMMNYLKRNGLVPQYRHVASSAATMGYPKTRLDMVRIGILQYGFWPSTESFVGYLQGKTDQRGPLERVISWKTRVMSTKEVRAGEFIGYGNSYMARQDMKIAAVPVGYADGYSRSLSNFGRILINQHRVGVVGTVNMNMLLADITDVPDTKKGDEVVLIGDQGDLTISVAAFGEMSDQLNYELLTKLSTSIPRIVVD
ncbi:MAG: alanine racemase [Flavobacteriales bacterium]